MPTILPYHLGVTAKDIRETSVHDVMENLPLSSSALRAAQKIADAAWPGILDTDDGCAAVMIGCGIPISHIAGEWDGVVKKAREIFEQQCCLLCAAYKHKPELNPCPKHGISRA